MNRLSMSAPPSLFRLLTIGLAGFGVVILSACRPPDDWRELRWPEANVLARFPCKPEQQRAPPGRAGLLAQCESEGRLYALAWQVFDTPEAARDGLAAIPQRWSGQAKSLPGAVPAAALAWPGSGRWSGGDGQRRVQLMAWAWGLTVYQATVVEGAALPEPQGRAAAFFDQVQRLP
ncbi:MAG: hypothetical protein ACK520_13485 [Inhella sp.]|nr:hypothetical protein [Inhella sp.]